MGSKEFYSPFQRRERAHFYPRSRPIKFLLLFLLALDLFHRCSGLESPTGVCVCVCVCVCRMEIIFAKVTNKNS